MTQIKLLKPTSKSSTQKNLVSSILRYRYVIVFIFSFLIYANTIGNDYNLDDELVTRNQAVTSAGLGIENLQKIFTHPYYQDNMGYSYGYRPLTTLSFTVEHSLFGDNPHISHFINLLLYCLLCIVLLKVMELMFKKYDPLLPVISVLIFAVHPLHTEVVASIKNRDEILSFLCGVSVFYAMFLENRSFIFRVSMSVFLLAAGMLFKPNLIMLPALLLLAILFFQKEKTRNILIASIIFSGISVFFIENVNDGSKIIYICANIIFTAVVLVFAGKCDPVRIFKNAIVSNKISIEASDAVSSGIKLRGTNYFLFLAANIILMLFAIYISAHFTNVWVLIIVLSIYVIEFYFFQFNQLWLVIILFDAIGIFLISGPNSFELTPLIRDNFSTLFTLFHVALLVNLEGKKFWAAFSVLFISYLAYVHFANDPGILMDLILLPAVVYIYKKSVYKNKIYTLLLFLVFVGVCYNWANTFYNFGKYKQFYFDLAAIFYAAIVFCISYFKISLSRIPFILAFVQITSLIILFQLSSEFQNSTTQNVHKVKTPVYKVEKTIQDIQSAKQLPSLAPNTNINRPILYIEFPVAFPPSAKTLVATSAYQFERYGLLLIKPWPMSFYYGYKEVGSHSLYEPAVIISIIIFMSLLTLALFSIKRDPIISFALFFMLLPILPYLSIVSVIPGMIADRYTFQSSFGFTLLASYFLVYIHRFLSGIIRAEQFDTKRSRQASGIIFMLIMLGYSSISVIRNSNWKDAVTLMRHDISVVPQSIQAHNLLAHHLITKSFEVTDAIEQKQLREEGLIHFKRSVELYPNFFNTNYDLARNFALLNEGDSAVFWFKKSIEIDTTFISAYLSVGEIYFQQNRYDDAIPYFQVVNKHMPTEYAAYDRLGLIYIRQKKYDSAMVEYTEGIKNVPAVPGSYLNIGIIYLNKNNPDSARVWFNKALQISPGNSDAIKLLQQLDKKPTNY